MEGSAAVAPAAADGDGQLQAPAQTQAPAAPEQTVSPEDQFNQRLQEMEQRAQAAEQQLQELQGPQPDDLLSALQGGEEDFGLSPEELAQAGQQQGVDPGQQDQQQQLAELESYIKDLAQSAAQEMVNPIHEQRQVERVQAWQKEHSDVTPGSDLFKEIVATMDGLAQRYDNDGVAFDTGLLDMAYTAAKAKLADAGAVPAEQAGANGASLETGAGQTQVGEDSEADQYRKLLTGGASNPLA
jgi:hypothetical protein